MTLGRARTRGGAGSSRATTRARSWPGQWTPRKGCKGSHYPSGWPPGTPGVWVAAPWVSYNTGALGSMVGCGAASELGAKARARGSPRTAVGKPQVEVTRAL